MASKLHECTGSMDIYIYIKEKNWARITEKGNNYHTNTHTHIYIYANTSTHIHTKQRQQSDQDYAITEGLDE